MLLSSKVTAAPTVPLTSRRRMALLVISCFATMHVMIAASCPMIALPFMAAYYHSSISAIAQIIGISVLAVGLATPLWAWLCRASVFGRRGAGLLGFAMYTISMIWLCVATSYASYAAGVFFTFAFGSVTQVVAVQQIAEAFEDETRRSRALATWYTSLVVGPTIGPILGAGFLAVPAHEKATAFRNVYYFLLVSGAVVLAAMAMWVPETAVVAATTTTAVAQHDRDDSEETLRADFEPTTMQKTLAWTRFYAPRVLPCATLNAVLFGWSVALHVIMAQRLYLAPYHFTPIQIGLSYLPSIGGALMGELMGGYLVTKGLAYGRQTFLTTSNPEQRLWALVVYLPFGMAGLLLFGFGFGRTLDWPIAIIAGQGLYTCYYCSAATVILTYLVEAHGGAQHASSIMCVLKVLRALFIFATLYFEPGWAALHGSPVKTAIASAFVYKTVILVTLVVGIATTFTLFKKTKPSAVRMDVLPK